MRTLESVEILIPALVGLVLSMFVRRQWRLGRQRPGETTDWRIHPVDFLVALLVGALYWLIVIRSSFETTEMTEYALLLLAAAFLASTSLTAALVWAGGRMRSYDTAGSHGHTKAEIRAVPNIGGVAIFWTIALPSLAGVIYLNMLTGEQAPEALATHLDGVQERTPMLLVLLGCLFALHLIGLVDDRRALSAWPKLIAQIVAAFVMVFFFESRLLTMLDTAGGLEPLAPWPSVLVSIAWLIVMTNAVNMLDNMDGLAGGVASIAGILFLVAALLNGQWFVACMLALLVGATLGFLVFNFPPASIFMGDGGSLVIGFLLGFLTIRTTYFGEAPDTSWYGVFMPVVVLAVPLYDFLSVVTIRLRQGRKPWVGDQQHFSHRLVEQGLSKRMAVLIIYGCTIATGLGGVALARLEPWQAALVGAQTVVILLVLAIYEHAARRGRRLETRP